MDWGVGAFAAFNLFRSFFAASWARMRYGLVGEGWNFFFTTFPLMFFALFLGIPGVRVVAQKLGRTGREQRTCASNADPSRRSSPPTAPRCRSNRPPAT